MTTLRTIDVSALTAPNSVQPGAAPMLQWIEVKLLVVDDAYQRTPAQRVIQRIADAFDWRKFSTVLVSPIEGELFAIIDGQHRAHAAAVCGIERVPCQVTIMDRVEQAKAFAAINGVATPVNPMVMFKAAVTAGEPWAIEVRDVAGEAGCRALQSALAAANRKPGDIMAWGYLRKAIEQHGRSKVVDALRVVRKARGLGDTVEAFNVGMLRPIVEAVATRPHVLVDPLRAAERLSSIDAFALHEEAKRFKIARRQKGLPDMAINDLLGSLVGDALDKAMPAQVGALPARHARGAA